MIQRPIAVITVINEIIVVFLAKQAFKISGEVRVKVYIFNIVGERYPGD